MKGLLLGLWLLAGARALPERLPAEVPALGGWECLLGSLEGGAVRYAFYVDPERPLLYRVTWYRVAKHDAGWGRAREVLLWNAHPGARLPLVCFERVESRNWRTLWLWKRARWSPLVPDSDVYKAEMLTAIRLYQVHNAIGRRAAEP